QAVEMPPTIDGPPASGSCHLVDAIAVKKAAVEDRHDRVFLVDDLPIHVHTSAHPPQVNTTFPRPPGATCRTRPGGDNTARMKGDPMFTDLLFCSEPAIIFAPTKKKTEVPPSRDEDKEDKDDADDEADDTDDEDEDLDEDFDEDDLDDVASDEDDDL